ncbi:hypothetical protein ASPVEDRAFT_429203 [Aspergillus versicolor CBS 583.65]|uniref:BTB domain-containing protein n=1 Tax=Aspergillus versicolor CBS 583.65 TaxID=1036611 RepID=A0A1L9P8M4_ASPVE|nr:uncharacterized protein ASPVEDRAFT_429203 [Aspergillus versicolor CBS 583.65]OJI97794.1 hypothetical protein ASPVEDRAFT_429203 [Aspergillus versicolor CBS 583.65]
MEPRRDFKSIINSVPFTFLVGPSHTKLTIQSGLAGHVSGPLDHLMNSGQTRESKHQIAVLEDEDVETFVAFCEYAYTGDYVVPPPGCREDDNEQDSINNTFNGMITKDTGTSTPAVGLAEPPQQPADVSIEPHVVLLSRNDNEGEDAREGEEEVGTLSQQPGRTEGEAWPLSTHTEYLAQDPAATPRESDRSPASSADPSPSRGRRLRRRKTDEQGFIQDPSFKLTPPCTPPGAARVESAQAAELPFAEPTENPHARTETAADQPNFTIRPMGHPESTFGNGVNEGGYDGDQNRQEEDPSRSRVQPVIDTSFANQQFSPHHEKGTTTLWDEFTVIDETDARPSHQATRSSNPPPGVALPYLIFHAKLYVFATRYLIPDLAHLCLQKLHHDLLNLAFPDSDPENQYVEQLVLTTTKARMVVDLLSYTYTKTTRLEPITPSSATQLRDNELRRLVVHYAACKVRDLAEYCPPTEPIVGSTFYSEASERPSARGFRALLDTLPELASDLIYRMI